MKSRTISQFHKLFSNLLKQVQEKARAAYPQFSKDPNYPSLRFKKVHLELPIYSVRISKNYRAVDQLDGDTVVWFWIDSHEIYDRLLKQF